MVKSCGKWQVFPKKKNSEREKNTQFCKLVENKTVFPFLLIIFHLTVCRVCSTV